jgi:hypothetical protein
MEDIMEEHRIYNALMQEKPGRVTGPSRVDQSNAERVIRVKIPASIRRMVSAYQNRGLGAIPYETKCTADEAVSDILRRFFEEHPI